ncbi:MAG TPA: flagellar basal body-associated FliL family protein [Armatimonadota bacterium]|nr:flagellar basal body-associated FliL family protein [Armatimonadota bacterium]HOS43197.1 flagellar basal body-associated FliL family protein [Armatimonadota bacterium]
MNKLMMVFVLVALAAGAGATFLMMHKGQKAHASAEAPKIVSVVPLEERTVNLADANAAHYVRLVLELEVVGPVSLEAAKGGGHGGHGGGGASGGAEKYRARLMDRLIFTVGRQRYATLITVKGKEHLKTELIEAFNEVLKADELEVREVLFTDFVME